MHVSIDGQIAIWVIKTIEEEDNYEEERRTNLKLKHVKCLCRLVLVG